MNPDEYRTEHLRAAAYLIRQGPATPQERRHLTEAELAAGFRLACQTFLRGDATVSWGVDAPPATPA